MAASIRVFQESSGASKTITVDAEMGVLAGQPDGSQDVYTKLSVDARTLAGNRITPFVITGDNDLVLGSTQYDGSTDSYAGLGEAVDDYVLRIVHGVPGQADTAMDFSS